MSDPLPSPERPAVKFTYMDRQKRKRKIADVADDLLNSDSSSTVITQATSKSTETVMKPPSKAPTSKGPMKIDFHLPGPAPKRARRDSEDTDATKTSPSEPKKLSHHRSTSSVSSLARVVQKVVASSPASAKPPSVRATKPLSSKRTATPETEVDDNASIADSVMSVTVGKIRRTETERVEYFRNQPECGTLELHRVFCTRCNKFVNLGRKQTYAVRPWETHRNKCDQRVLSSHIKTSDDYIQNEQGAEEGDHASAVESLSASRRVPRKTTAERKAILEADPRVAIVKSDEVKCRKCEKWIRLSSTMEYSLWNWNKHALICYDAMPSSRVATATRKLQLVNDSPAKESGIYNVNCAACNRDVDLGQAIDDDLTKWEEHKTQCQCAPSITKTSGTSKSGASNPELGLAFPRSSASTEGTLVASDPTNPAPLAPSAKRVRDEDDIPAEDPDARPSNRPRSETYMPPEKEAPGPLGWFLLPFKAFVQGFRESIKSS